MDYFLIFVNLFQIFSKIIRPLLDLEKKSPVYDFTDDCLTAFNKLRDKLMKAPILAIYNPNHETELHCDASTHGYGAVLLQKQNDSKFHPVAYFSKTTTAAESRYHSFELETLAIINALERFHVYLDGIPFKIVTDCNSLAMTLHKKRVNSRIARWALELEKYNYAIQHKSGATMTHVDVLSRIPCIDTSKSIIKTSECHFIAAIDGEDLDFHIQVAQNRDENLKNILNKLENNTVEGFELCDGLVFKLKSNKRLLCVPKEMEENIIRMVHEKIGHLGTEKCYSEILKNYWFSNMREKITKFIQNCIKCIIYSVPARSNDHCLYNIPKEPIPFDTVHVDHFGPLPNIKSKRKHIFVVVDAFTKYVKLYPVNSTSTKEVNNC